MGWLNQGESAGLDVHLYLSVYLNAPECLHDFDQGTFYVQMLCMSTDFACIFKYNIGRGPYMKDGLNQASLMNRHYKR